MSSLADSIRLGRKLRALQNDKSEMVSVSFKNPPGQVLQSQPNHIEEFAATRFNINDEAIVTYLENNGYVVIKDVCSKEEVSVAIELLWNYLSSYGDMAQNQPSTWTNSNFQNVGAVMNGIIGSHGIGQSSFQWYVRTLPKVKQAFASIFSTDDLICSFDGGNVFRPWYTGNESSLDRQTTTGWFHVDQGRSLKGRHCIQGLISLTDCSKETGGFCCIPTSHTQHEKFIACQLGDDNYYKIPNDAEVLKLPQILPVCHAGDLILWDSRTVHCSTPAFIPSLQKENGLLRIASYVAMTPYSFASESVIKLRIQAYQYNITTTHWPHLLSSFKIPESATIVNPIELASEARKSLIGIR